MVLLCPILLCAINSLLSSTLSQTLTFILSFPFSVCNLCIAEILFRQILCSLHERLLVLNNKFVSLSDIAQSAEKFPYFLNLFLMSSVQNILLPHQYNFCETMARTFFQGAIICRNSSAVEKRMPKIPSRRKRLKVCYTKSEPFGFI